MPREQIAAFAIVARLVRLRAFSGATEHKTVAKTRKETSLVAKDQGLYCIEMLERSREGQWFVRKSVSFTTQLAMEKALSEIRRNTHSVSGPQVWEPFSSGMESGEAFTLSPRYRVRWIHRPA